MGQLLCGSGGDGEQPLHRDVDAEDAPPAIGAELDGGGSQRQGS